MNEREDKLAQALVRIEEIRERIATKQDENTLALAKILERVVERAARTEQMTAQILADVAHPGRVH